MLATAVFFALACSTGQQALDQRVTFTCSAEPVQTALAQISRQSGVALQVEPPVSSEMVVLRLKNVPLQVAMDKIAYAATGEWSKTEAGYRLTRPNTLVHSIEQQERLARLQTISKYLSKSLKDLAEFNANSIRGYFESMSYRATHDGSEREGPAPTLTNQAGEKTRNIESPENRLALRMLSAIGAQTLADLPTGQRLVFSFNPTAMQRPVNGSAADAVQAYVGEQALWSKISTDVWKSKLGQDVSQGTTGSTGGTATGGGDGSFAQTFAIDEISPYGNNLSIDRPVSKVLLILTLDADAGADIQFKICDAKGRIMAEPRTELRLMDSDATQETPETEAGKSSSQKAPAETAIQLSPLAKELQMLLSRGYEGENPNPFGAGSRKAGDALKAFLLRPEENDPLTLLPSEPILKAAEAKDLDVAVCVDDASFSMSATVSGTPTEVLESLPISIGAAKVADGWFVGHPARPLHPRREGRKTLGEFLRACAGKGRVGLEPLAAYAQEISAYNESLGSDMAGIVVDDSFSQNSMSDWAYVRLYGSLSPLQRAELLRGDKLVLAGLSPSQWNTIKSIVYMQDAERTDASEPQFDMNAPPEKIRQQYMEMMADRSNLVTEPTELLPNGLDGRITVSMTSTDSAIVFAACTINDMPLPSQGMDPDTLAMLVMESESRSFFFWGNGGDAPNVKISGYRMGRRQSYNFTIDLPEKCCDTGTVSDEQSTPGPALTLSQLPAEIQAKVKERKEEMQKMLEEMKKHPEQYMPQRQGGGSTIPPP